MLAPAGPVSLLHQLAVSQCCLEWKMLTYRVMCTGQYLHRRTGVCARAHV